MNLFLKILNFLWILTLGIGFFLLKFITLFISILLFVFVIITINTGSYSVLDYIKFYLAIILPIIILFLLTFLFFRYKNKLCKTITGLSLITGFVLSIKCGILIIHILFIFNIIFYTADSNIHNKVNYSMEYEDTIKKNERTKNFFPSRPPFKIYYDFEYKKIQKDNSDKVVTFLCFQADEKYIKNIIYQNRNKIDEIVGKKDIEKIKYIFSESSTSWDEYGKLYFVDTSPYNNDLAFIGITDEDKILFYYAENFLNNNNTIEDYNK